MENPSIDPVGQADKIHSRAIELWELGRVKPNPKNRNKHDDAQIDRLARIIEFQGFRTPLIVSKQSGLLVAGHGRLLAAKKLNLKFVPVMLQDFDNPDQEYAAQISDNSISAWAELDLSAINTDLADLGPIDLDLLGIKNFTLDCFEHEIEDDEPKEESEAKFKIEVQFPNDMEMNDVKDDLILRGYIVRVV